MGLRYIPDCAVLVQAGGSALQGAALRFFAPLVPFFRVGLEPWGRSFRGVQPGFGVMRVHEMPGWASWMLSLQTGARPRFPG